MLYNKYIVDLLKGKIYNLLCTSLGHFLSHPKMQKIVLVYYSAKNSGLRILTFHKFPILIEVNIIHIVRKMFLPL